MRSVFWAVGTAVLVIGTWAYALLLFEPAVHHADPAPGALVNRVNSDLFPVWVGTRAFWQGQDPYSPAVTQAVQVGTYGRPLTAADPSYHQLGFTYPLYTAFLFAPFALLPFDWAKALFGLLVPTLSAVTTAGWIAGLGVKPSRRLRLLLIAMGAATPAALMVFVTGQPALLAALFLAGAVWLLRQAEGSAPWVGPTGETPSPPRRPAPYYLAAGTLLALATIKPQFSAVVLAWLLGWAVAGWRQRGGVLLGFGATLAALTGAAVLVVPNWITAWLGVLADYQRAALGSTTLGIATGIGPLEIATVGIGLGLTAYLWWVRRAAAGSLPFDLALALAGFYTLVLFLAWASYHQQILYPALILVVAGGPAFAVLGRLGRIVQGASILLLLLPYLLATLLIAAWGAARLAGAAQAAATLASLWPWPWIIGFVAPLVVLVPLGVLVRVALQNWPKSTLDRPS